MTEQIVMTGRNIRGDLAKLSRDFPEFVAPSKDSVHEVKNIIEVGTLAKAKNAVPTGNASLAAITAATLHQNLSKETCISEWSAQTLSDSQVEYAALDAWVLLQIFEVLKNEKTVGLALASASPVGQLVSLFIRKQEVAKGVIIQQPHQFAVAYDSSGNAIMLNISSTQTRAVIRIDEVLAPNYILSYHKKTLAELKGNQLSFEIVVSLSMLRTHGDKPPAPLHLKQALLENLIIICLLSILPLKEILVLTLQTTQMRIWIQMNTQMQRI